MPKTPPGLVSTLHQAFGTFAQRTARASGHPWTFMSAVFLIIVWGVTGPLFGFSDTWQLIINTGTTIVTFLMVFLIQNTQNRDSLALQLKLSELVLAMKGARNSYASIEDMSDDELEALHSDCRKRAAQVLAIRRSRANPRPAKAHSKAHSRRSPHRSASHKRAAARN